MMVTIMKKGKIKKLGWECFKNMGGNIPGGNFLGENFPVGSFSDTEKVLSYCITAIISEYVQIKELKFNAKECYCRDGSLITLHVKTISQNKQFRKTMKLI